MSRDYVERLREQNRNLKDVIRRLLDAEGLVRSELSVRVVTDGTGALSFHFHLCAPQLNEREVIDELYRLLRAELNSMGIGLDIKSEEGDPSEEHPEGAAPDPVKP